MKKAVLILAPGFEESEALTIVDIVRRARLRCDLASLEGATVSGAHGISVMCDHALEQVYVQGWQYDMVILPGGYDAVDHLRGDKRFLEFLKNMNDQEHFICALCAAPLILHEAGILKGRHYTVYPGCEKEMNGGIYEDQNIVTDQNIITGRGPAMAYMLGYKVVNLLGGDAQAVKEKMLYSHSFIEEV